MKKILGIIVVFILILTGCGADGVSLGDPITEEEITNSEDWYEDDNGYYHYAYATNGIDFELSKAWDSEEFNYLDVTISRDVKGNNTGNDIIFNLSNSENRNIISGTIENGEENDEISKKDINIEKIFKDNNMQDVFFKSLNLIDASNFTYDVLYNTDNNIISFDK